MTSRYSKSSLFLMRAEKVIPLGSQTFSKSRAVYPKGAAPLFADRAKGPHIWDLDGHKYIDFVSNLASITLGYANKGQNRAVKKQLRKSVGMSLPARLETVVAEKIIQLVPSAEMVRFGKNGTDVTSAAVRLSRAYTGRSRVAVCGYHGWQDWYIGSTNRGKGVPEGVSSLTHTFEYNNLSSLRELFEEYPDEIACVILEPMNRDWPKDNFLESVIKICEEKGAICIFDETITGFRFSSGGAQELFGVSPHLSTFGKGIANGFPISAICGKREIMMEMENIFFSGTFGGELLSLAAANYVLDLHIQDEIVPELNFIGQEMANKIEGIVLSLGLESVIRISGHNVWKFLNYEDCSNASSLQIKSLVFQELIKGGILILNSLNVNLSHTRKVQKEAEDVFFAAFSQLSKSLSLGSIENDLKFEPLNPIMRIR